MYSKKLLFVSCLVSVCFIFSLPVFAASTISVVVDNKPVTFDTQPFIENGRTLVPLRAIAESAGMKVDYDEKNRTVTLTKTDKLLKIPLDTNNPYVEGKTHVVTLKLEDNMATIDGSNIQLDVPARVVEGRTVVPLRFISEAMDMDVIWSSAGLGILNGTPGVMISTRLRGSAPLPGADVFPFVSPELISVKDSTGKSLVLGMDVTEMQKNLGEPVFAWGRGVPSPQTRYEYGANTSSAPDIEKAYAEIGCSLSKVTVIQLGPGSGSKLFTGMGITAGDSVADIVKAYEGSENLLTEHYSNGHILIAYVGDTLKYAVSIESDFISDYSESDITHVLDFTISNEKITAIAIADVVSARELSNGRKST
jgi:hypothetical protein